MPAAKYGWKHQHRAIAASSTGSGVGRADLAGTLTTGRSSAGDVSHRPVILAHR